MWKDPDTVEIWDWIFIINSLQYLQVSFLPVKQVRVISEMLSIMISLCLNLILKKIFPYIPKKKQKHFSLTSRLTSLMKEKYKTWVNS